MKRVIASFVGVTACLAMAAGPAAAGPEEDLVTGTGQGVFATDFGAFSSEAHVNAQGGPTDAHGHAWARFFDSPIGDLLIKGSVFCVDAQGNQATVGLLVEQSNAVVVPVGSRVIRKVVDNGAGANDPPDETGTTTAFQSPVCPPAATPIPTGPVEQGNFVVMDAG